MATNSLPRSPRRRSVQLGAVHTTPIEKGNSAAPSNWRQWEWRNALLDALERREINTSALAVGIALSQFADNRTGESFPSIATIARRLGFKVDNEGECKSVSRLLKALKRAGLVEIRKRGRDQTNLYAPRFPARQAGHEGEIGKTLSLGEGQSWSREDEIGTNQSPIEGQTCSHEGDSGQIYPPQGDEFVGVTSLNELSNDSLSLRSAESDEPSRGASAGLVDEFERFTSGFPFTSTMSRPAAWREFVKLCPSDQECAIRQAARYASDCKRDGIQFPRHAATWLHDREFTGSEAKAQTVELSKALVFVAFGTPAFEAWIRAGHKRLLNFSHDASSAKTGWWFPSEFPPERATAAE